MELKTRFEPKRKERSNLRLALPEKKANNSSNLSVAKYVLCLVLYFHKETPIF
jgi:hypothetical protein